MPVFWKAKETRIARKYFGVERNPIDGSHQADCENDWLVVEMFNHKFPSYLVRELEQAISCNPNPEKKLSIVVWSEKGKKDEDSLVVMRLTDFVDWFGG